MTNRCPSCGTSYGRIQRASSAEGDRGVAAVETRMSNSGVVGGLAAIGGAVLWFVVGYFVLHRIFFYPAVLLVIGCIAIVDGIAKEKARKAREQREADRAERGERP